MNAHHDIHALACGVHSALVVLHLLGLGYAAVRGNRNDGLIHVGAALFSIRATRRHICACR